MPPSPLSRVARLLLIVHSFLNIGQGIYSLASPSAYAESVGAMLSGASDQALGSIGLGALGVGWYQLVGVYQGNRGLILATIPMRLGFAGVMAYWGMMPVVGYEVGVAVLASIAAFA